MGSRPTHYQIILNLCLLSTFSTMYDVSIHYLEGQVKAAIITAYNKEGKKQSQKKLTATVTVTVTVTNSRSKEEVKVKQVPSFHVRLNKTKQSKNPKVTAQIGRPGGGGFPLSLSGTAIIRSSKNRHRRKSFHPFFLSLLLLENKEQRAEEWAYLPPPPPWGCEKKTGRNWKLRNRCPNCRVGQKLRSIGYVRKLDSEEGLV